MTDEWPSFAQELSRKVTEQIEKWSRAYDAGSITKREFYILICGLSDATSGLVTADVRDLLSTIHAALRAKQES